MNKKLFVKMIGLLLVCSVIVSCLTVFVGCKDTTGTTNGKVYDNENDPLVFSTQEVDKVFNPFFSTTATDSNVVGMTQIGLLGNDEYGQPTYGEDEAVIALDYEIVTTGTPDVDQTTTYKFVLKNNVRFSNGSYMTIKDVLFNLYVYLDPAYTGSSTIYSTDIVGLKEYRTQEANENEQDHFLEKFQTQAMARIDALLEADSYIKDEHELDADLADKYVDYLEEHEADGPSYANLVADYNKTVELFMEELNSDYSNNMNSYQDISFTDETGKLYKNLLTTDVEAFLYAENYISWSKKDGKLTSSLVNDPADLKTWTKEAAINAVFQDKIPDALDEVLQYWNTSVTMYDYLVNDEMEKHFAQGGALSFPNISGIRFANRTEAVTVNNKTYAVPTYAEDGHVTEGNEVLSITINGVDPKAIWNFAFAVAPMYYYSSSNWNGKNYIAAFDYESNFGVQYNSQTFMTEVVKDPNKIGVPVGAGAYAASKEQGGLENIEAGDFYKLGVIYFERNPYFIMGPAKIKKLRMQVVPTARLLDSLYGGEVDFAEPNAKPETREELNGKKDDGIGNKAIKTSGYGYIGVNAGKVPSIKVRQAIMHSINTLECVEYYKTEAEAIYRSMSKASWAYPDGCTAYYPYVGAPVPENLNVVNPDYKDFVLSKGKKAGDMLTEAEQLEFLRGLVESADYKPNGNGVYQKGNDILKYTFTVAGEEQDHPAWNALFHAGEILNKVGFQINVTTDARALIKLSSGELTVWAAAWGSTIDPDMYQVYHKDSKATSVLNWGYKQILQNVGGKYDIEYGIVEELSELIDKARETTVQSTRERIYSEALDLVMQLAVELPTYQRDDLFAFNANKIDVNSLTPDNRTSPYKGLTSDIHLVSLVTER